MSPSSFPTQLRAGRKKRNSSHTSPSSASPTPSHPHQGTKGGYILLLAPFSRVGGKETPALDSPGGEGDPQHNPQKSSAPGRKEGTRQRPRNAHAAPRQKGEKKWTAASPLALLQAGESPLEIAKTCLVPFCEILLECPCVRRDSSSISLCPSPWWARGGGGDLPLA